VNRFKLLIAILVLIVLSFGCGETSTEEPTAQPPTDVPSTPTMAQEATEPSATEEPTETSIPTDKPAPTDTPVPTKTALPTPVPEVLTFSGSGDSIVDVDTDGRPYIIHVVGNSSERYFSVKSLDSDNENIDLLVNTTDSYDGYQPFDWIDDEHTFRLEIKATGDWSVELIPLAKIEEMERFMVEIPGEFERSGDDVLIIAGGTPDKARIVGNEDGRYFGVVGWSGDRRDLLVNTTDTYEGTVLLKPETTAIQVGAIGAWTVEVTTTD
jgi:hypothetical protein